MAKFPDGNGALRVIYEKKLELLRGREDCVLMKVLDICEYM